MSGLLGYMAAGAAQGFAEGRSREIQQQKDFDLKRALLDAQTEKEMLMQERGIKLKEDAEQRRDDRIKQRNIDDLKSIREMSDRNLATDSLKGLGDAAIGASVDAESLKALKENPAALEAYRKAGATGLLNSTRQQQAEADTNSALAIGRSDYADKFESVAKGERQDAKLDAQIERDEKRWKLDHDTRAKQFEIQMKKADASEARAERRFNASESNATIRAKQSSMVEALKANAEAAKDISRQLKDEMDKSARESLQEDYKEKMQEVSRISKQLETYANTGSFDAPKQKDDVKVRAKDAPSLDQIFGNAQLNNTKQAQPEAKKQAGKPANDSKRAVDRMWNRPENRLDDIDPDQLRLGEYSRR